MRCVLFLLCLPVLLFGCNNYKQENNRLKEEIKMVVEENNYAKAEIIGLKKEVAELSGKVKEEREALHAKLEEERGLMEKKIEEMRGAMQKKAEADKKKGGAAKKDQLQKSAGPGGNKVKQAATKTAPQKTPNNKKPAGESHDEE